MDFVALGRKQPTILAKSSQGQADETPSDDNHVIPPPASVARALLEPNAGQFRRQGQERLDSVHSSPYPTATIVLWQTTRLLVRSEGSVNIPDSRLFPLVRCSDYAARGTLHTMDFASLKEQVSNLTLYDIKAGVRKVQNG